MARMLSKGIFAARKEALFDGSGQAGHGCASPASFVSRGSDGALRGLMLVAAAVLLAGCAGGAAAWQAYDARFDREVVAGHDDARGNFVEVRISPHRSLQNQRAGAAAKAVVPADGNTGGTPMPPAQGKEVLR